jgi:phospholipid/cholesterol/gamma-HCH transport system ATP-binding protein
MAQEQAMVDAGHHAGGVDDVEGIVPQMKATPGMPFRQAVARRQERVRHIMHTLPEHAQAAIVDSFHASDQAVDDYAFDAPTESFAQLQMTPAWTAPSRPDAH